MCGGDNAHRAVTEATRNTVSTHNQNTKGVRCVTCVLAGLRAHYTTHAIPQTKNEREREQKGEEKKGKGVVLDGGGARLADAATRHHPTQTRKKKNSGEQNKHQRTQTIQKTSTRPSTTNGHHTLPSMRSKTPIHQ